MSSDYFTPDAVRIVLGQASPVNDYLVAYSGGLDSHVLLHVLVTLSCKYGYKLSAVHVNHALYDDADAWAEHCRRVCQSLNIPCKVINVDAKAVRGASQEASARTARYNALSELLQPQQSLLTAHHMDDQVETFLLQLMRGSGLRGLSSMPLVQSFSHGYLVRPMLGFTRDALYEYALQQGLHWIEDQSNADLSFDRNYLRRKILPLIYDRWPGSRQTIARSAAFAAETVALAELLAHQDLIKARAVADNALSVSVLQNMTAERRRNLLREWIREAKLPVPSAVVLERISTEVLQAARDREPLVKWDSGEVRRYRDRIYVLAPLPQATPDTSIAWESSGTSLPLGELRYYHVRGTGLRASALNSYRVQIRFRRGGETIRPPGRGGQRSVKNLLQEYAIPPWLRNLMPLIYIDDQLAAIPGICIDCEWLAGETEDGIEPYWLLPPELAGLMPTV